MNGVEQDEVFIEYRNIATGIKKDMFMKILDEAMSHANYTGNDPDIFEKAQTLEHFIKGIDVQIKDK